MLSTRANMEVYEAILTKRKEQSIKGFHIKQIQTLLNVFRLFQVHVLLNGLVVNINCFHLCVL